MELEQIIYNIKIPNVCITLKDFGAICNIVKGINLSLNKTIKIIIDFNDKTIDNNMITILEQKIKASCLLYLDKKIIFSIIFVGNNINNSISIKENKIDLTGIFKPINGVKKIILVCSGKGGVGKSTISSNLAIKLSQNNKKIGLLDADIYGASIPSIFGIENEKVEVINEKLEPIIKYNISIMSIGLLSAPEIPIIWRGPMLSKALYQMFRQANWQDLDYLIIDTPPGTGDIHISLMQNYPIDGIILVSTNDKLSEINTNKTATLFNNFGIPTIGKILNMSDTKNNYNDCVPYNKDIRINNDNGKPFCLTNNDLFCENIINSLICF